jgi:lysophospholipase L1-like esterase
VDLYHQFITVEGSAMSLNGVLMSLGRALAIVLAIGWASGTALAGHKTQFIASWAVGHINPIAADIVQYDDQTLREVVRISAGGERVRVRIANTFGTDTLTIGEARVAKSASGSSIVPGTNKVLTFGGCASVDIPAGDQALSDPVHLDVDPLTELAVSLYLPDATPVETTTLFQGTSFVSLSSGNHTGAVNLPSPSPVPAWPFISGIDVSAPKKGASIVALGDSATITSEWPRFLGERLQARRSTDHLSSVSVAIAGNRLLFDSASPTGPADPNPQWGESALNRFDRDVLDQAGAEHVIVFIGLNDIAGPGTFFPPSEEVTLDDLIDGFLELIDRAHDEGLTIQACTLPPLGGNTSLPGYDTPEHEAQRVALNEWIRTSGEFDDVIDVDLVLRDPSDPTKLLPAYDSGDHLHPNAAGGQAIADAIDLKVFRQ